MDTHEHHEIGAGRKRLALALGIVLLILVMEVVGGILSGSLALLGDAGHMLVDALALGLSFFAITIATRPANARKTFGYYRVEIMAALANGTLLILVAIYIFYEAYQRFLEPPEVNVTIMLIVAAVGLAANVSGILLLRGFHGGSLNIKAAFWHILGDTLSSVGVIIAGLVILFTGWTTADPLIAVLIGCVVLWGAIRLVREAGDILLEAVPPHIDPEKVTKAMERVEGVEQVHDLHIWTITSGLYALSAHMRIKDQTVSKSGEILRAEMALLEKEFDIRHTTLQLECQSCPTDSICTACPLNADPKSRR